MPTNLPRKLAGVLLAVLASEAGHKDLHALVNQAHLFGYLCVVVRLQEVFLKHFLGALHSAAEVAHDLSWFRGLVLRVVLSHVGLICRFRVEDLAAEVTDDAVFSRVLDLDMGVQQDLVPVLGATKVAAEDLQRVSVTLVAQHLRAYLVFVVTLITHVEVGTLVRS